MFWKRMLGAVLGLLAVPAVAPAAGHAALPLPHWTVAPFILLLLAIAVLPLAAGHFWHRNRNKLLVSAVFALPVAGYLLYLGSETKGRSTDVLTHSLIDYAAFIMLLAALYTVSGGIIIRGDIRGRPLTNTAILAFGGVLANLIGTTGASMLLIRPVLHINRQRRHTRHLPVFFIFVVSNLGGLLTPLGDPPLFLGFLEGVPFFWTLSLWRQWLVANGIVLGIFLAWDTVAYWREPREALARDLQQVEPLRVQGLVNLVFLAGILVAVLLQSRQVTDLIHAWLRRWFACPDLTLSPLTGGLVMLFMALLSLLFTPRGVRADNAFSWEPIVEVAVLFAGIFVTMVPALNLVEQLSAQLRGLLAWHYFWLTGSLSSFLDNAPTYVTFAKLAAGMNRIGWLAANDVTALTAISCGAVFMGANTYIGNGPNFMVKAIAEEAGYKMPSFLGYLLFSGLLLLPVFGLVTYLFFWPS
jgi:Na+/H+ antiporter NhaD/arsenite permease-like protein